jgi:hypothetical protein
MKINEDNILEEISNHIIQSQEALQNRDYKLAIDHSSKGIDVTVNRINRNPEKNEY